MYDSNYDNDFRVRAGRERKRDGFDKKRMVFVHTIYDDFDDEEYQAEFPAKWELCGTCEGRGSHVNPSVDCGGLSADDFYEDPDFREDYFRGAYDVQCYECHGRTTSPVMDFDRFTEQNQKDYELLEAHWQSMAELDAMYAAERRMGA